MKSMMLAALAGLSCAFAPFVLAQEEPAEADPLAELPWHVGPATEKVGSQAVFKTSADLAYLDQASSRTFLELTGNIPEDGLNIVASQSGDWWATFQFDDMGYVKDDEEINADELLETLKASDEPANEERARLGIPALHTEGWAVPPHYDTETKRLEWGLRLSSEGMPVVNYTIRILGRKGVMNAVLVADPETLQKDVAAFKAALAGFEFNPGERYAEYREGDRVAEYGLAALVVGGAAAVAAKSGLLAKFWKLIVGGVVVLAGVVKRIFSGRSKT